MGFLKDVFSSLTKPRSYLNLILFILLSILLFIIGIIFFVITIVCVSFVVSLVFTVFIYKITEVNFGSWIIDSFPEAILISIIGIIFLAILLYVINKLANIFKKNVSIQIGRYNLGKKKK